ncbi:helix-turn-helix transcriptional regulator [Streptomyces sp. NBC_01136]|uniref:TrmB family transcriptional regulator n=1 Tax=unclassified Streptomyces TaxID=2593676 RepID=UPI003252ED41|nr:helix-turn-helix transcriptional regulator [Streptomyces sp. NBC_01136]
MDVYRLVIAEPGWGVTEIARGLGLTEPEVRSELDRLARLSLLHCAGGAADVAAISPDVGLAAHIWRRESEILGQQRELAAMQAYSAELTAVYAAQRAGHGNQGLELLEGVNEVRAHLSEVARNARSELLAFMPGGAQSPEALEASRPLDEWSLLAGVRLRTIYLDSVRNDRATTEYAHWLAELGGQIRTIPSLPLRMLIADRSTALLPLSPEDSRAGAVVLRAPGVIDALLALFDLVWEQAVPFGAGRRPAAKGPSQQELELLRLLERGLTDEVAGRKMGLSLRTTRRMMSGICSRLGARSRFEVGVLAERAGWL